MKRFAMERLERWKRDPERLPMIIRGARQVGKTWLMREFGSLYFVPLSVGGRSIREPVPPHAP